MRLTGFQQFSLVTLRTAIGWQFAYEGFYKLMLPGWTRGGERIAAFSAEGYLRSATGPFASMFHSMASHPALTHAIDLAVPIGLLVVGLSLMLGLFTQIGCAGAMAFLLLFYLSQPPLTGMPMTGAEGENLIVNKNLIELFAVLAVFTFRTGSIAGLDHLRAPRGSLAAQGSVRVAGMGGQHP
jgi:thiosulfate dehydrogenase (quinone) large subunit